MEASLWGFSVIFGPTAGNINQTVGSYLAAPSRTLKSLHLRLAVRLRHSRSGLRHIKYLPATAQLTTVVFRLRGAGGCAGLRSRFKGEFGLRATVRVKGWRICGRVRREGRIGDL